MPLDPQVSTLDPIRVIKGLMEDLRNRTAGRQEKVAPVPQPPIDAPIQQPQVQPQVQQQAEPSRFKIPEGILKMLPALIAGGVGIASKGARPGATGFLTGYEESRRRKEELGLEKEKEGLTSEQKKWDDAYKTAIALSKTGVMGGIEEMTPQQLEQKAQDVYNIRYGTQKVGVDVPVISESLPKPPNVKQEDWDAASEEQKRDFLKSL